MGEAAQIVPDATICARHLAVRVFLELDRSTRGLSRIAEALERYGAFFRDAHEDVFRDRRTPHLLYVVRSPGRKEGITAQAEKVLEAPQLDVTEDDLAGLDAFD